MTLSKIVLATTAERSICLSSRAASSPREESKKRSRDWKEGREGKRSREAADQGLPSFQVYHYSCRPRIKHRFIGLWKCLRIANSYWIVRISALRFEKAISSGLKYRQQISLMKFQGSKNFLYKYCIEFTRHCFPIASFFLWKKNYYLIRRRNFRAIYNSNWDHLSHLLLLTECLISSCCIA